MTLDQLTERIHQTLEDAGLTILGGHLPRLAEQIARDIARTESLGVWFNEAGGIKCFEHEGRPLVYLDDGQISLPVDWNGRIERDDLAPLLACLLHIERTEIR